MRQFNSGVKWVLSNLLLYANVTGIQPADRQLRLAPYCKGMYCKWASLISADFTHTDSNMLVIFLHLEIWLQLFSDLHQSVCKWL